MHSNRVRVGVDIGGTFTDFVFLDENTGEIYLEKTSTTPKDLWEGIATGLEKAKLDLRSVSMFIHGTTVGLNAFLSARGRRQDSLPPGALEMFTR